MPTRLNHFVELANSVTEHKERLQAALRAEHTLDRGDVASVIACLAAVNSTLRTAEAIFLRQ